MGSTGTRFGRNFPLEHTYPEQDPRLHTPDARKVSLELHTRDEFVPATTLNVLAAAWLQFEVHDWFSHGPNDPDDPWFLSLDEADAWPNKPMEIRKTPRDPSADPGGPQTWITADSTGGTARRSTAATRPSSTRRGCGRTARCASIPDGMLPADLDEGPDFTDVPGSHWIGLSVLHTLFTLEHNAICDRAQDGVPDVVRRPALRQGPHDQRRPDGEDPHGRLDAGDHRAPDDQARHARPVVGSGHGAGQAPLRADSARARSLSGIPGSPTDHHGVPYSLTEEFVAVYRMHPLDPGRVLVPLAERPRPTVRGHLPRAERPARPGAARRVHDAERALLARASRIQARSCCTTSRASSSSSSGRTGSSWTSARWTSCASASGASRATRSSASSCT